MTYVTATVPIAKRIGDVLPLFQHPHYVGGYPNLAYIKSLGPGRDKDPRGVMLYRVENDQSMSLCSPNCSVLKPASSDDDRCRLGHSSRRITRDNVSVYRIG